MDFKKYRHKPDDVEGFRLDIFKELDVDESPRSLDLFQKAWHYGHSGGFEEVYDHFKDLVGMFLDSGGEF